MTDDADSEETTDPEQETVDAEDGEERSASAGADDGDAADDEDEERDAELSNGYDDTIPNVELGLYQLSVRVSGRSEDDLQTVEDSAKRLMDYLIDRAGELEERPDDRGLG